MLLGFANVNGNIIFTGSLDQTVRKWNIFKKKCLGIIRLKGKILRGMELLK